MTIKELCAMTKAAIKCAIGLHEPSKFITYHFNGNDYQVCRWCMKTIKPAKRTLQVMEATMDEDDEKEVSGLFTDD